MLKFRFADKMPRAISTLKRAAIVHADIQGYSRLMADDEAGTAKVVSRSIDHMTQLVSDYTGQVVQISGDAVLALFQDPAQALQLAIRLQKDMAHQADWSAGNVRIAFRIGIAFGYVLAGSSGFQGHHINVATRIQELAPADGIYVCKSFEAATKHLFDGLVLRSVGRPKLKNIDESIEVFSVEYKHQGALLNKSPKQFEARSWFSNSEAMVAVLPLEGLVHDTSYDQICSDLSGNIAANLARFCELSVVAHHSATLIKHFGMPTKQIRQHLGVRYIVGGGLQRDGAQVLLRIELMDTEKSSILWSGRFSSLDTKRRSSSENLALANLMASRLAVEIDLAERRRFSDLDATDLTAHGLVLKGLNLKMPESKEANLKARQLYMQAIQHDPAYVRSYAVISETYFHEWRHNWSNNPDQAIDTALAMAIEATERDPREACGFVAVGKAYMSMKNYNAALNSYRVAMELNPNNWTVLLWTADALTITGHYDRAKEMLNRANAINPYARDLYHWLLGDNCIHVGDYKGALRSFERMLPNPEAYRALAHTYAQLGSIEKARSNAAALIKHYPNFSLDHYGSILPHRSPELVRQIIDGLREAGLE